MVVYEKINNAVRIMDEGRTANGSIPPQHTRVLDVTEAINDPKRNVIEPGLVNAISQSFLKDEVAKMYQGEIVLRFMPQLEPYDIIVVNDASTMMVRPDRGRYRHARVFDGSWRHHCRQAARRRDR